MVAALKVPFVLGSDGRIYDVNAAPSGMTFKCPACTSAVFRRTARGRRPHFFHAAAPHCSEESIVHEAAKYAVAQTLQNALKGKARPTICRPCDTCFDVVEEPLGIHYTNVLVEEHIANGRCPDILLLTQNLPVACVEICHTHAVDDDKAADLHLPWIELKALDVLSRPMQWFPSQCYLSQNDWFAEVRCEVCQRRCSNARIVIDKLSVICKQKIFNRPFCVATAPYRCPRCEKGILVYGWSREYSFDDAYMFFNTDSGADWPETPETLVRGSNCESQLQNSCPRCKEIISDDILWASLDGPFHGLEYLLRGDVGDDFNDYILSRIALNMECLGRFDFSKVPT